MLAAGVEGDVVGELKEKILGKLLETVRDWRPRRRSQAMATQSLPVIATQAPPLMLKGLDWIVC